MLNNSTSENRSVISGAGCTFEMDTPELPVEVITYILSFLQGPDRKDASLVCKIWYLASQDYQFKKKVTYRFPASSVSLDGIRGLGRHPCYSVAISHLDSSPFSRAILQQVALHLGPRLECLSLRGSSITESSFLAVAPHLPALRRLDLSCCDSLFMSGTLLSKEESRQAVRAALRNLEELDLSSLHFLSDLTFNRLTGCSPDLRRLSLAGCHIAFQFDPYRGSSVGCDSTAMLSLKNLHRFLSERAPSLKGLNLGRTGVTPEGLRSLVQVRGLCLEELTLQGCKDLTDQAMTALWKWQPGLKTLDLSFCTELSDKTLLAISSNLKELQCLNLAKNRRITDSGLSDLMELKCLQSLDFSECSYISGGQLVKGLYSPQAQARLVSLSFSSCTLITDLTMFSLAQLVGPSLRVLDLTSCLYLTDLSVRAITTYLPGLVVLRLGWCKEVSDWGLLGLEEPTQECKPDKEKDDKGPKFSRNFGNMGFFSPPKRYLEEKPRRVTKQDLVEFGEREGASLLALRDLQELDLTACTKLTDASITQVLRFQDLRTLSLSMLSEITDSSLVSVASHCRGLTRLNLSHCPTLTDHGLSIAARSLHRLQHLHLSCCDKITDRSLTVLAEECKALKSLDVSMCKKVSMAAVELLQSQLPSLENTHTLFVGGADLFFTL
ncbi:F-box/LRR-repeat protein 2 isoform X3 [Polyodon spathula]|uniref:F-box/LRR-repeat protein 2 isoform X3 n=1 Tax=Polyodon spathula TaxID=7913 RepID=UPI001B7F685F|nr:F-box/LRR-repeat protein 2 isoform X3 [Polyodon spathula]